MSERKKSKRPVNPRREFSLRTQLVAKYGDEIVAELHALAKPKRKRRRRRNPVTA